MVWSCKGSERTSLMHNPCSGIHKIVNPCGRPAIRNYANPLLQGLTRKQEYNRQYFLGLRGFSKSVGMEILHNSV